MTSDRKIRANRANARFSTGPKTIRGRARAAQNARRHGLSVPVWSDPALGNEVDAIARKVAGPNATPEIQELARLVAETQVDLRRIRSVRHQLLSRSWKDKGLVMAQDKPRLISGDMTSGTAADLAPSTVQGMEKLAVVLTDEAKQLLTLDRYERRATSRRKFAIRALDEARRRHGLVTLPED
jgi:hypothetical protein